MQGLARLSVGTMIIKRIDLSTDILYMFTLLNHLSYVLIVLLKGRKLVILIHEDNF